MAEGFFEQLVQSVNMDKIDLLKKGWMKELLPAKTTALSSEMRERLFARRAPVELIPVVKQPKTPRDLLIERRDVLGRQMRKEPKPSKELMSKWQDLSMEISHTPRI